MNIISRTKENDFVVRKFEIKIEIEINGVPNTLRNSSSLDYHSLYYTVRSISVVNIRKV